MEFLTEQKEAQFLAADEVIGEQVVNAGDEEVGEIADLVMDQDQKLVGVVLSVGGFLGIGEKWVAIPVASIEFPTDEQPARLLVAGDQGAARERAGLRHARHRRGGGGGRAGPDADAAAAACSRRRPPPRRSSSFQAAGGGHAGVTPAPPRLHGLVASGQRSGQSFSHHCPAVDGTSAP